MRITKQQKKLFYFLKEREKKQKSFTLEELSKATGYPLKASVKAKMSRNEWSEFIAKDNNDSYFSEGVLQIELNEFLRRISTKNRLSPYNGKLEKYDQDTRTLIQVSKNEFILAIELFNRPSTPNRLDAFLAHFINAFEKLLKAKTIQEKGRSAIWRNSKAEKKTKSIREILKETFPENSPLRMNLEYIIDLRDLSTHYILPELASIASRYFQSGVFNYSKLYQDFTDEKPIELEGIGLLSLVIEGKNLSINSLNKKYGNKKAHEIKSLIEKFQKKANAVRNPYFAIPVNLSIGIVDNSKNPNQTLANLTSSNAIFVEKTKDPKLSHPFMVKEVVKEVNNRILNHFSKDKLQEILPTRKKIEFNTDDFNSICENEKWKSQSNIFHFDHGNQVQHTYSEKCIDFIVKKLKTDKEYLSRVKKKRQSRIKKLKE
ncbi:DUF3644 domain-containing protein [Maribacter algicola]|uniref:DUF3644 domain-containing protein n=1 Tax=Meishania litoralis TaxID=3434685 RepID=A0ACC7LGJ7_9FLAO